MKSHIMTVSVALLAFCCLLIPQGGKCAGGIVSLQQSDGEKAPDQLQGESLDDPESEQELAVDPHPLRNIIKARRDTGAAQPGKWRKVYFLCP